MENHELTMEHHDFEWVNQLLMAGFNIYVGLPEGIPRMTMLIGENITTNREIPRESQFQTSRR